MTSNLAEHLLDLAVANGQQSAFVFRGQEVTYDELSRTSRQLGTLFAQYGVRERDRVLLVMNDTPATVACFLGAMTIGAIPVVLNPRIRLETLRYILDDSDAKAVVCERDNQISVQHALADTGKLRAALFVQDLYSEGEELAARALSAAYGCDERTSFIRLPDAEGAFWQYTSGTTGTPKAVIHSAHGMVRNNELYARRVLGIEPGDRIYSAAKMFFGYGLGASLFFTLLNRATALLDDRWPTPKLVLENVAAFRPTLLFAGPTLYAALQDRGSELRTHMQYPARFCSAGSPLPGALFKAWKQLYEIEILDGLGATEMGHIFLTNRPNQARPGSTGTPVDDYAIELRDGDARCVADGEQGVLWAQGPSTALGYHALPELTAERFVDGWYRTGDLFRVDDGHYTYLGREDDLFKVNGRWVAPSPIEQFVLNEFHCVSEVALVPRRNTVGLLEPTLFLVADPDSHDSGALEARLDAALADAFDSYQCPSAYAFLDGLPKNDNGKLVRSALADMSQPIQGA